MSENSTSFAEFWPKYLAAHADARNRVSHYCGTAMGVLLLIAFLAGVGWWLLPVALVAGYGPAWAGHALFERNRPATFDHPLWSFIGDFRMLFLAATGELHAERERLGLC
ncbi:MAG TPA: DUF962 domain-containing protein [Stellaceae bacterium]|nr:DUF962 domain-containing protein [Stellaceae bacterium]